MNKPAGILSIPDRFDDTKFSIYKYLQNKYGEIFIVHRLDKDTSGVMIMAKNAVAHKYFSQIFENRKVEKIYLGLVVGSLPEKSGTVNEIIAEHPSHKGMMVVARKGKPSITHYEVLEDLGRFSVVQFKIETGRTHQIRVHMKYVGHPIVADPLYGDGEPVLVSSFKKKYNLSKKEEEERPILSRLALHAFRLEFNDNAGKPVALEAKLQKDMQALISQLQKSRN